MPKTTMWQTATIELLDPSSVLVDDEDNSRTIEDIEAEDPVLVSSIKEHGVEIPIIAHRRADGIAALDGFSRVLVARKYTDTHPTIPAIISDDPDMDVCERLRSQWIANEVRRGYSAADKARILHQMTLFGLSTDEIATQLTVDPKMVEAGVKVQRSKTATAATKKHPQLDIFQLEAFAEFEDDAEATHELESTLVDEPEQFQHTVSELRYDRHARQAQEAKAAELRANGVTVVDHDTTETTLPLYRLLRSADDRTTLSLDPEAHAFCPGHAASVAKHGSVTYVCQNWKNHGHLDKHGTTGTSATGRKSAKEKAELKRVRHHNERYSAAQPVRREHLENLVALGSGKKPPKRALQNILMALAQGDDHLIQGLRNGSRFACKLLGLTEPQPGQPSPLFTKAKRATNNEAILMLLAIVTGAFEEAIDADTKAGRDTWRNPSPGDKLHLAALQQDWGYTPSKTERLILDPTADAQDWEHLRDDTTNDPHSESQLDGHEPAPDETEPTDASEEDGAADPEEPLGTEEDPADIAKNERSAVTT